MALSRDDKIRFVQPTSRQSEKGFVELSWVIIQALRGGGCY